MERKHPDFCTASVAELSYMHHKDCPLATPHQEGTNWEREFDIKYTNLDRACECCGGAIQNHWKGGIKDFIRSAITEEREAIVKTLPFLRTSPNELKAEIAHNKGEALAAATNRGFNEAVRQIRSAIEARSK